MEANAAQMRLGRTCRSKCIIDTDDLHQLSRTERSRLKEVSEHFAFRSNEYYLSLINWDDPGDPIRRLIIPDIEELSRWGQLDASCEDSITVRQGVQHKYGSTVILLVTEMCGGFCRYCFRKRLFISGNSEINCDIDEGVEYVRHHPEVNNVLVTGGDPMILSTTAIDRILTALRCIDHVRIIRIGTKIPAFDPFRFINDKQLLKVLAKHSLPNKRIYLMCHFDHPRELTPEAITAIDLIQKAGVICVNQNPIIRGISDRPEVMSELWNELSFIGVPQYYVFQNRPTAGNRPYQVPIVEAYFAIEKAKRHCSGLGKSAKYVMSHETGKMEIIAVDENHIYLKYHRAKHVEDEQKLIICHRDDNAYWFDQLQPVGVVHCAI